MWWSHTLVSYLFVVWLHCVLMQNFSSASGPHSRLKLGSTGRTQIPTCLSKFRLKSCTVRKSAKPNVDSQSGVFTTVLIASCATRGTSSTGNVLNNPEAVCLLRGTDWNFNCNYILMRLSRAQHRQGHVNLALYWGSTQRRIHRCARFINCQQCALRTTADQWSRNSSQKTLICGNKMPTRCNRGFYCRSYCLLNMFRAPLCPSAGLCVRFAGCWFTSILQTGHITLSSTPDQLLQKPQHEIPQAATTV